MDAMRIDLDNCRDPDLLAGEVRRLRAVIASEQVLTDKEREAVELAIDSMNGVEDISASWSQRETAAVATLRCLLQRHFPVPENPPAQDNTPEQHPNPDEVSVRPECAAWMTKPFYVDPASGWRYGFPKLYDPAEDGDMTEWMVANGYPQHLADQNLPCTFTAKIDSQHLD